MTASCREVFPWLRGESDQGYQHATPESKRKLAGQHPLPARKEIRTVDLYG